MNDTDEYILNAIKLQVWSGFSSPDDVQQMIDDILEDDADEPFLRSQVAPEFERKANAEKSWPKETDCDRLDRAFNVLNSNGIIAVRHRTALWQSCSSSSRHLMRSWQDLI